MPRRQRERFDQLSEVELIRLSCERRGPAGREAYGVLVNRYGPSLSRLAETLVGPQDVDDLVQTVWTCGWRSRCTFRGDTEVELHGWLGTIARNEANRMNGRRAHEREFFGEHGLGALSVRNRAAAWQSIADAKERIGDAVEKLRLEDPRAAELLYAKYVELWTWEQIVVRFALGTVHNARQKVTEARNALVRFL